jgi:hypothetical protein
MLTGEQLLARLQALTPEQRKLPVLHPDSDWGLVPVKSGLVVETVQDRDGSYFVRDYFGYRDEDETYREAIIIE